MVHLGAGADHVDGTGCVITLPDFESKIQGHCCIQSSGIDRLFGLSGHGMIDIPRHRGSNRLQSSGLFV